MNRTVAGLVAVVCVVGRAAAAPIPAQREGTEPYVRWTVPSDSPKYQVHDPLVVNDLVVAGADRGDLRAFKADTGKEAWTHRHGARIVYHPETDGERVFSTADNVVAAVAAADGTLAWSCPLATNHNGVPVFARPGLGMVVVADDDGTLYARDAKTGGGRWKTDYVTDAPPDPPGFPGGQFRQNRKAWPAALTADAAAVYLSVLDQSRVVAFAADTGTRLWSFQAGGGIYGAAVVTPTRVFVGSQDKCVYALDRATGKEVWRFAADGPVEAGGAADAANVYFASTGGRVYALRQSDGAEQWRFETDPKADGKRAAIYAAPVVRRGSVVFAAGRGQVYAVAADTGRLRWQFRAEADSDLWSSPATDGRSFFVTTRKRIVKWGEPTMGGPALVAIALR